MKFQLFDIAGAEIYKIDQHIVSLAKVKYVRNKVIITPGNFDSTIQEWISFFIIKNSQCL